MNWTDCKIPITRGKNKGKECGEVNKKCRHKVMTCKSCSMVFYRDTAYFNHLKECETTTDTQELRSTVGRLMDIDMDIKHQNRKSHSDRILVIEKAIDELSSRAVTADELKSTVAKIQPSVNFITNNIQIVVSDVGAYKALCGRMGTDEATDFLCELASKPKTITLFEKVYLEGDPTDYPIANNDGKDFYYRDSNNNIVCDTGGHEIAKLGKRLMQNTFLEAADPLLTRFVSHNGGDRDGDDEDYDRFRELQNAACRCKDDKTFTLDLYKKTFNPKHIFFMGQNCLE